MFQARKGRKTDRQREDFFMGRNVAKTRQSAETC